MSDMQRGFVRLAAAGAVLLWAGACSDSPQVLLQRGHAALAAGSADSAEAWFLEAVKQDPDFVEGHLALGELYLRQGRLEESEVHYATVADLRPFHAVAHLNLALIRTSAEDFDAAAEFARTAQKHAQHDRIRTEVALLQRAIDHARTLHAEQAAHLAKLADDPDNVDALTALADSYEAYVILYGGVNLLDVAARIQGRALEVEQRLVGVWEGRAADSPGMVLPQLQHCEALARLAWTCHRTGDRDAAEAARQRCLVACRKVREDPALAPTGADKALAWYTEGRMSLLGGDLATAIDCAGRAAELAPEDARYAAALAELFFRQGRPLEEIAEPLRRAARLAPNEASHHVLLGDVLARTGDPEGAKAAYRNALRYASLPSDVERAQEGLTRLEQGLPLPELAPRQSETLEVFDDL